jgi:anaerobic selenocysteine-containing dehydrogenase
MAAVTEAALRAEPDGVLAVGGSIALATATATEVPKADGYGLRLSVSRRLYDAAVSTAFSPSLTKLADGAVAHLHPHDFERITTANGTEVTITGARSSAVLPVVSDPGVARGVVWIAANQPGSSVGELISGADAVTDVRVESL